MFHILWGAYVILIAVEELFSITIFPSIYSIVQSTLKLIPKIPWQFLIHILSSSKLWSLKTTTWENILLSSNDRRKRCSYSTYYTYFSIVNKITCWKVSFWISDYAAYWRVQHAQVPEQQDQAGLWQVGRELQEDHRNKLGLSVQKQCFGYRISFLKGQCHKMDICLKV